jgi:hypothetical protein
MSDAFDWLKRGSAGHTVKVASDGSLDISAVGSDKDSLEAFQPIARMALHAESEGHVRIEITHMSSRYPGDLYDRIIISRVQARTTFQRKMTLG